MYEVNGMCAIGFKSEECARALADESMRIALESRYDPSKGSFVFEEGDEEENKENEENKEGETSRKIYSFPDLGVTVSGARDEQDARRAAEIGLEGCLEAGYDPRPGKGHGRRGGGEE